MNRTSILFAALCVAVLGFALSGGANLARGRRLLRPPLHVRPRPLVVVLTVCRLRELPSAASLPVVPSRMRRELWRLRCSGLLRGPGRVLLRLLVRPRRLALGRLRSGHLQLLLRGPGELPSASSLPPVPSRLWRELRELWRRLCRSGLLRGPGRVRCSGALRRSGAGSVRSCCRRALRSGRLRSSRLQLLLRGPGELPSAAPLPAVPSRLRRELRKLWRRLCRSGLLCGSGRAALLRLRAAAVALVRLRLAQWPHRRLLR